MPSTPRPRRRPGPARLLAVALAAVALAGVALVGAAAPAGAAVITVTTTDDEVDANGLTSLREAMAAAGSNGQDDEIVLANGATYQLDLCAEGPLVHDEDHELRVEGIAVVEQTCPDERTFRMEDGDLEIEHLTLRGAGEGISSQGSAISTDPVNQVGVTIIDSTIEQNDDRVVFTSGPVEVLASVIRDNPDGAIFGASTIDIDRSFFIDNGTAVPEGGGVVTTTSGSIVVDESSFIGNQALVGGALSNTNGDTTVTESTFVDNSANFGGAIRAANPGADVTVESTTFAGNSAANGAHVYVGSSDLDATASVFADPLVGDSCVVAGATTSGGGNHEEGDDSCGLATGTDVQDGADPLLEPYDLFGLDEVALVPGPQSPVVDMISDPLCATLGQDQARRDRPIDGDLDEVAECDAGSIERPLVLFDDVDDDHPFAFEIGWMAWNLVSEGYADGTYKPSVAVSRQAMSAFMYRLAGEPPFVAPGVPTFSDVPTGHPFYDEVEWMADEGISEGYEDGTYKPASAVTRQAMSAFMYRLAPLLPT